LIFEAEVELHRRELHIFDALLSRRKHINASRISRNTLVERETREEDGRRQDSIQREFCFTTASAQHHYQLAVLSHFLAYISARICSSKVSDPENGGFPRFLLPSRLYQGDHVPTPLPPTTPNPRVCMLILVHASRSLLYALA
jgi:hypothetical protein